MLQFRQVTASKGNMEFDSEFFVIKLFFSKCTKSRVKIPWLKSRSFFHLLANTPKHVTS